MRNLPLSIRTVSSLTATARKWKPGDIELTINDILQRRGIPMRMKVYSSWEEFMERINGLEAPDSESEKRVSMAKEAVLSACL